MKSSLYHRLIGRDTKYAQRFSKQISCIVISEILTSKHKKRPLRGWCGREMALGTFQCWSVLLISMTVWQKTFFACIWSDCVFWRSDFLSTVPLFFLPPSWLRLDMDETLSQKAMLPSTLANNADLYQRRAFTFCIQITAISNYMIPYKTDALRLWMYAINYEDMRQCSMYMYDVFALRQRKQLWSCWDGQST